MNPAWKLSFGLLLGVALSCAGGGTGGREQSVGTSAPPTSPGAFEVRVSHSEPRCERIDLEERSTAGCWCPYGSACDCDVVLTQDSEGCELTLTISRITGEPCCSRLDGGVGRVVGTPIVHPSKTRIGRGENIRLCSAWFQCPR
jgi:hypothetical protein